jgi:O-antigen ligase/polysaccharide polymerase Wzy-like membrane protein
MQAFYMNESLKNSEEIAYKDIFPRVPLVYILLFAGYVIIWYLQIGYRYPALGTIRIEFLYAVILIILSFTVRTNFSNPLYIYLLVFMFFLVIQLPLSQAYDYSKMVFVDRVIKFMFMGYFIVVFVKSPRDLKIFLAAFLLACFKMGQEGVLGVKTGGLMWENQGVMRLHGSTPMYTHPNSFSGMAMGMLPFAYYLFPHVKKYIKLFLLSLIGFAGVIVLYTGSRTGYVAFIIFWLFVLLNSKYKKKLLIAAIPLTIVGILVMPQQYKERFETIFTLEEKEGQSAETRIQILEDAVQVFTEYPFGVGISAFPAVRMKMFNRFQDTHNLYLEVLTNLGIQGFIAFFLLVFMMLKMLHGLKWQFDDLIRWLQEKFPLISEEDYSEEDKKKLSDLKFLKAVSQAVFMFIIIRLALGLFGMDLYEIYWWFSFGLLIALENIAHNYTLLVAEKER